jgi:hypothetical protein
LISLRRGSKEFRLFDNEVPDYSDRKERGSNKRTEETAVTLSTIICRSTGHKYYQDDQHREDKVSQICNRHGNMRNESKTILGKPEAECYSYMGHLWVNGRTLTKFVLKKTL